MSCEASLLPLCAGSIEIALPDGTLKRIGITRAHLEEDAGKPGHHLGYWLEDSTCPDNVVLLLCQEIL